MVSVKFRTRATLFNRVLVKADTEHMDSCVLVFTKWGEKVKINSGGLYGEASPVNLKTVSVVGIKCSPVVRKVQLK